MLFIVFFQMSRSRSQSRFTSSAKSVKFPRQISSKKQFLLVNRFMSNIAAPKIPDGDKVDFDVSRLQSNKSFKKVRMSKHQLSLCGFFFLFFLFLPMAGHPQEASGERPVWAAVADRGSLHPEEERGGRAHRPCQQNCAFYPGREFWHLWHFQRRLQNRPCVLQEKRRAERAEQQRVRAEREKDRQARMAVRHKSRCTLAARLPRVVFGGMWLHPGLHSTPDVLPTGGEGAEGAGGAAQEARRGRQEEEGPLKHDPAVQRRAEGHSATVIWENPF